MNAPLFRTFLLLAAALFLAPKPVFAEYSADYCLALERNLPTDADAAAVIFALQEGHGGLCFGKITCRDQALCQRVDEFEKLAQPALTPENVDAQRVAAREVLDAIGAAAAAAVRDFPELQPLLDKFILWQPAGSLIETGNNDRQREVLGETQDSWTTGGTLFIHGREVFDVFDQINAGCAEAPASCREQFGLGRAFFELVTLQKRVLDQLTAPQRRKLLESLERANARWDRFFDKSRSLSVLFPWELYVNSLLFDGTRDPEAFDGPPSWQLILLHPSIGVHVKPNADDTIQQTIVLEMIGYYGWAWGGENKAQMKRPLGGSAILSFDGQDDPNFGAMAHLPRNWSLGLTINRDNDVAILLSVDLAKAIQNNDQVRRILTGGSWF